MREPVRLVIWDLDDTLWQGTLSEGPISQIADRQEVVKALARRGIISAICSRNDLSKAKAVLESQGLWEYFVFPSINWEPKGPRIKALVESAQLRPASVLFVDDNPSNLEEAKVFNPGLQVESVDFVSHMMDAPHLAGKADPELARLRQYKVLEQRKTDAGDSSEGVESFLRQSDIRVSIRYDLSDRLDRAIELINRTNQLNFTRRRLPDNIDDARKELATQLQSHEIQAGLLHVVDRYGDHGDAGFYMVRNGTELLHFCFSCRILGMGVESWLYRRLGRPLLTGSTQVASDPAKDNREIDWIHLVEHLSPQSAIEAPQWRFDWVAARGGCDLQALSHYFRMRSTKVLGEFNVGRIGFDARVDHSTFLRYAIGGVSAEAVQEAAQIGYRTEDFQTGLTSARQGKGLIILSFWSDVAYALYRHRRLGFTVPFALSGRSDHRQDARMAAVEELPPEARRGWMAHALARLQSDYDYLGPIGEDQFKENLGVVLRALPSTARVILLSSNTRLKDATDGVTHTSTDNVRLNQWLCEIASLHPHVQIADIRDGITRESEVLDWTHFDRIVYYRLYQRICELVN
jgi:FkbH-like protein